MKNYDYANKKIQSYTAPALYPGLFYALLAVWTVVCVIMLGTKAVQTGWPPGQLLMLAFVIAYTWYFSLGIAYRIQVSNDGTIEFSRVRSKITISASDIETAEGPRLAILPIGFVRFRLEREKAYLFCTIADERFQRALSAIRAANPEIKIKGL